MVYKRFALTKNVAILIQLKQKIVSFWRNLDTPLFTFQVFMIFSRLLLGIVILSFGSLSYSMKRKREDRQIGNGKDFVGSGPQHEKNGWTRMKNSIINGDVEQIDSLIKAGRTFFNNDGLNRCFKDAIVSKKIFPTLQGRKIWIRLFKDWNIGD